MCNLVIMVCKVLLTFVNPNVVNSVSPPPSMGFFRQEYWSGVPLPSPYRNTMAQRATWASVHVCQFPWPPDPMGTC